MAKTHKNGAKVDALWIPSPVLQKLKRHQGLLAALGTHKSLGELGAELILKGVGSVNLADITQAATQLTEDKAA
jgi:hypothetical protein